MAHTCAFLSCAHEATVLKPYSPCPPILKALVAPRRKSLKYKDFLYLRTSAISDAQVTTRSTQMLLKDV